MTTAPLPASPGTPSTPSTPGTAAAAARTLNTRAVDGGTTRATLEGKVALITGAAGGIGHATAARFAAAGARLVLADLDAARGEKAAAGLCAAGADALAVHVDVTDDGSVAAMAARTIDHFGKIDVLFHVAGGSGRRRGDGPVHKATVEGWDWTLNLNLRSAFLCARAVVPHMLERGSGSVIFLSSIQGLAGGGEWFDAHGYVAAKSALVGLTRAMATYYAPQHIRVNAICPGTIRTPMAARVDSDPALLAFVARMQPLTGGPGEADDVAAAAHFLASDDARMITGISLPVDGGWSAF